MEVKISKRHQKAQGQNWRAAEKNHVPFTDEEASPSQADREGTATDKKAATRENTIM